MSTDKQTVPPTDTPTDEPKKEVLGIERDDKNCRVSFTTDGNLIIITMPLGHMPRVVAHGFIYELHDMINAWFHERAAAKKKIEIVGRDHMNKFSFKQGLSKILGRS